MKFITIESTMTLFFWSSLFGIAIDKVLGKYDYTKREFVFVLVAIIGATLILKPTMVFSEWG